MVEKSRKNRTLVKQDELTPVMSERTRESRETVVEDLMPVREQSRLYFVVDITFDHPYKVMEPHNDADCGKRNRVYIYCGSEQYT